MSHISDAIQSGISVYHTDATHLIHLSCSDRDISPGRAPEHKSRSRSRSHSPENPEQSEDEAVCHNIMRTALSQYLRYVTNSLEESCISCVDFRTDVIYIKAALRSGMEGEFYEKLNDEPETLRNDR